MSRNDIHDKTFINCMTDKQVAQQFFIQYLPKKILELTCLNDLMLQKNTYIDKKLRKSVTDIVYGAQIAGKIGYFYVLVEHKSAAEQLMPLQVMRYMLAIMHDHTKQYKTKELPLVYPLIFYHGLESPYPYARALGELFPKAYAETGLSFLTQPMQIIDVGQIPDEAFREYAWSGLMSFVMKHRSTQELVNYLEDMRDAFYDIAIADGYDYYKILLEYIFHLSSPDQYDQILKVLHRMDKKVGEITMTAWDVLMSKGVAKGMEEGIERGRQAGLEIGMQKGMQEGIEKGRQDGIVKGMQASREQLARRMLEKGINLETVTEITGLSAEVLKTLDPSH